MTSDLQVMVARALLASGLEVVEMGEGTAVVRLPEGEEHTIGLANLARTLALTPDADRPRVLERYVRGWLDQARRAALDMPRPLDAIQLFPRLLAADDPGLSVGSLWTEPLVEGELLYALAVDEPDAIRFVSMLDLPRWGLPLVEARRRAMSNLVRSSAAVAVAVRERGRPFAPFEVSTGDGWDASRLLIAHQLVPGGRGVLALAPARDLLLCVPVREPGDWGAALSEAMLRRSWAERAVYELPYPLSPELFWCSEGVLELVPVVEGPAGRAIAQPSDRVLALASGQDT